MAMTFFRAGMLLAVLVACVAAPTVLGEPLKLTLGVYQSGGGDADLLLIGAGEEGADDMQAAEPFQAFQEPDQYGIAASFKADLAAYDSIEFTIVPGHDQEEFSAKKLEEIQISMRSKDGSCDVAALEKVSSTPGMAEYSEDADPKVMAEGSSVSALLNGDGDGSGIFLYCPDEPFGSGNYQPDVQFTATLESKDVSFSSLTLHFDMPKHIDSISGEAEWTISSLDYAFIRGSGTSKVDPPPLDWREQDAKEEEEEEPSKKSKSKKSKKGKLSKKQVKKLCKGAKSKSKCKKAKKHCKFNKKKGCVPK